MTQFIKKLPAVFQTSTEKKFFDATVDQVFTKKNSDYLAGYLGRREPGHHDPINDFYVPEPSKNRTRWQLEATSFARNEDTSKSNIFFYNELLEKIAYYGGNVSNQARLFSTDYYSFAPPIDYDMFINFHNYYWVEERLPAITITGVISTDIIGQTKYVTPETATPPLFTLSSGMTVILTDDANFSAPHTVQNLGGCTGIRLVPHNSDFTAGSTFEFLPWSGEMELSTRRVISNGVWDATTWDTQAQPGTADYITVERGSLTQNAWSRTNKWYHIDTITASGTATGNGFPASATRALRPIIQFDADLNMWHAGTQFRNEIKFGFRNIADGTPLRRASYNGALLSVLNDQLDIGITDGDLVCFFNDTAPIDPWDITSWDFNDNWDYGDKSVNDFIFRATVDDSGNVFFVAVSRITPPQPAEPFATSHWDDPIAEGDILFITEDGPYDAAQRGQTWFYSAGVWDEVANEKISVNQPPIFQLYDHNGIRLDDPITYPLSTFAGSKIFSYKVSTITGATVDPVLKFPIVYTSLGQSSDIIFQNNLIVDQYLFSSNKTTIEGYYYYKITGDTTLYNGWDLHNPCKCQQTIGCITESKQRVIDKYVVGYGAEFQFKLSVVPVGYPTASDIVVSVDGTEIKSADKSAYGYTIYNINNSVYVDLSAYFLTKATSISVDSTKKKGDVKVATTSNISTLAGLSAIDGVSIRANDRILVKDQTLQNTNGIYIASAGAWVRAADMASWDDVPGAYVFIKSGTYKNTGFVNTSSTVGVLNTTDITWVKAQSISSTAKASSVEISTYTRGSLDNTAPGYFEIPQQLEANPLQEEVFEISGSNLIPHFSSVIANQADIVGDAFGGNNNYRDTVRNRSLGTYILQNMSPLLKTMLVSSSDDLDLIKALRFSQDEYTKFKNKYIRASLQLVNEGFSAAEYTANTIVMNSWVDEILKTINISKEFSHSFSYSNMIAHGSPYSTEVHNAPLTGTIVLTSYVDLTNDNAALYIYDKSTGERLLTVGKDYELISTDLIIEIKMSASIAAGTPLAFELFVDCAPAYIPSTPASLGMAPAYIPRIELDATYVTPVFVIVGHDGSRTVAYNDKRDDLLLELETRIYNCLKYKTRTQTRFSLRAESIRPGAFRDTRYTRSEYLKIAESHINKWSAKNRANYRVNSWAEDSLTIDASLLWKMYNYTDAINTNGVYLNLHGSWRSIFTEYYDTIRPDTAPWEMLGFAEQPSWWADEYGAGVLNSNNQRVWPSTNTHLWEDLELGIIRRGITAVYNPSTNQPITVEMWARPGLVDIIPVTSTGELRSVMDIFNVVFSGNIYNPFDGFDKDWIFGDMSSVENAWMSTSSYAFSMQEFMFLMKPATYGETMWDTLGTDYSPGKFTVPVIGEVLSTENYQYVQTDMYSTPNTRTAWYRPKNALQVVHGEQVNGNVQLRSGYQRWISDRILYLGKDVSTTFGLKIRTLGVNLANKFAGFTNKDTSTSYIVAATPGSNATSLAIPSANYDVVLHKSATVETYSYSGVIIRGLANGMFAVYGYDLLNSEFTVLNRSTNQLVEVSVGGEPAPYDYFTPGDTYVAGDIVRYNGVYYQSKTTHVADKFNNEAWIKLRGLPTVGGIAVSYKPITDGTESTVPYGTVFTDVQSVFDFLISWGAYLESKGWVFDEVSSNTNQLNDWLTAGKQFLFWLNTSWAENASIQLSPLANKAVLNVSRGYPDDVEMLSNGVYSILDKSGRAIPPKQTTTMREGQKITVEPASLAAGGIYYLQVNTSEIEHALIYDNTTNFGDILYAPLLRQRQQRIRFNGFRSNGWYGKMEAPGYLVNGNALIPNFDTIVDSMRDYYNPNTRLDNSITEEMGRHLIGYSEQEFMNNLDITDNIQYMFYKGAIREKGTVKAFDKMFRSTAVCTTDTIDVHEEWALKLGDFGNTIEQVSTEFVLTPEQNTGEVIVARLNYMPSHIGFLKQINILNAENTYDTPPKIKITLPDADPADSNLTQPLRQAKAFAVLNSAGKIARIDIADNGYGYLSAPTVEIDAGSVVHNLDRIYSVWQGEIVKDSTLDNVVNIDIDQPTKWTVRPNDPAHSLIFPTTTDIDYGMPNAGYANFNDVDWATFGIEQLSTNWGTVKLNPVERDTVWVAKTFTEDWGVYKLVNVISTYSSLSAWKVVKDTSGVLVLTVDTGFSITPEFGAAGSLKTDLGNLVVLQSLSNTVLADSANYVAGIIPYTGSDYRNPGVYIDQDTSLEYNAYILVSPTTGDPLDDTVIGMYAELNSLMLFKTMRVIELPATLPYYVASPDLIWVDNIDNGWGVLKMMPESHTWDHWGEEQWEAAAWDTGTWHLINYRKQSRLIDTSLFESARVFSKKTDAEIVRLPTYDPFKRVLPGPAIQNITYMSMQDPARYNVTDNSALLSDNILFGEQQVGMLWWDMSSSRYVYYEQPTALDGSETEGDNLVYRRDNWGALFPGSVVDIYEWVKSPTIPAEYIGTGTPKDLNSYVKIITSDRFTSNTIVNYYFWVIGATSRPNLTNRTMAAIDVARLLQSPKSQGFTFFAPIQHQQGINNSYMFYNVQEILSYQGDNVQVSYRLSAREDQEHTQWAFYRAGDQNSIVADQFWDKLVDSLCGYTKPLPVSEEYSNGIIVAKTLPWDIYGWDVALSDSAINTSSASYGEILPVPDPTLGNSERLGINYRPRQGMFSKISSARKVFVQAANELLKTIPIRDNVPGWADNISSNQFWEYTTWYATGYENITTYKVYSTLSLAMDALSAGNLNSGDIIKVVNGTSDSRYMMYAVVRLDADTPALSLTPVAIDKSAIKLLDTIYTTSNIYRLSTEIRELMDSFRIYVMVDEYKVYQNELFYSMMNYVLSEQKSPDWLFKSSYIYINDKNLGLGKDYLYTPDRTSNVIAYMNDIKPYHTHIRDYSSSYVTKDIAPGSSVDSYKIRTKLKFGPELSGIDAEGHWDTIVSGGETIPQAWDNYAWDVAEKPLWVFDSSIFTDNLEQFISYSNTLTVLLDNPDNSKKGYSSLYPFTFTLNDIGINNPQTIIMPADVVGIQVGNNVLIYGRDYYVEYNNDNTYTAYLFNNPGIFTPTALIWIDGGSMQHTRFNTSRNEVAHGFSTSGVVINVDTLLPVNIVDGGIVPMAGWGDAWDNVSGDAATVLIAAGGTTQVPWDGPLNIALLESSISAKVHTSDTGAETIFRNSSELSGVLLIDVFAPTSASENIGTIRISATTDIFPDPTIHLAKAIWINGERIEYKTKTLISANVWELGTLRRGTNGTAPAMHSAMAPNKLTTGSSPTVVWVEQGNLLPTTAVLHMWSLLGNTVQPDLSTEFLPGKYTNIANAPIGGLWYSATQVADMLRAKPGVSIH